MRLPSFAFAAALLVAAFACACHHPPPISLAPLPRAAYAHYLAAKVALYQDDAATAVDELTAATAAAPEQPMIVVELARALAKANRAGDARALLATARTRWPEHAPVWLASGDLVGDAAPADAARAYRRAIELEPADERAYLGLARLALAGGDAATAERTLRELVARVPTSTDGHYRLAQRLAARGDLEGAAGQLRVVIERDPDHIDARLDLARASRRLGHLDQAIAQTRGAFDRASEPLDIAEELFWLLVEADDRTGARDLLALLDDDRSDVDALAIVARLDRSLGQLAEARAIAARIAAQDPDAGAVALAELELAIGDATAAVAAATSVPEASPRFAAARRIAGEARLALGEPALAIEAVAPARRQKPRDAELALVHATALADAGKPGEGRALIVGLRRERDERNLQFAQARFEDHAGDVAAALAILEPLARARPDDAQVANLAGYLLAESGRRLADAARYLDRARALAPGDPAILDSWGWLALRRGAVRDAIRALDRASRYAPHEPEILVHLAAAWAADRAPRTAADVLAHAAALHPARATQRKIDALRASLPP